MVSSEDVAAPAAVSGEPAVAVAGVASEVQTPFGGEQPASDTEETGVTPESDSELPDRYPEDIPVAILSLILAASPFLPWYRMPLGRTTAITASGWATGTWGPMITFIGVLSLMLVILRRAGVRVSLPVADAHIHEGVGWLSIIGAVIKFRMVPVSAPFGMERSWGAWVAIASAFLLAFVAGRMSSATPLVTIPGWFRGRAGRIGIALMLVVAGGAAAFGMTNTVDVQKLATGRTGGRTGNLSSPPSVVQNAYPKCAKEFPKPTDAQPKSGVESKQGTPCVFTFEHTSSIDQMLAFYKRELTKAGYEYQVQSSKVPTVPGHALTFSSPECGQMSIQRAAGAKTTTVIVVVGGKCITLPSPSGTPSPSK